MKTRLSFVSNSSSSSFCIVGVCIDDAPFDENKCKKMRKRLTNDKRVFIIHNLRQ